MSKNIKRRKLNKKIKYLKDKYNISRNEAIVIHTTNSPIKVRMKFMPNGTVIDATGLNKKQFRKLCRENGKIS